MARNAVLWAIFILCISADLALAQSEGPLATQSDQGQPQAQQTEEDAPPAAEGEDLTSPDGDMPQADTGDDGAPDEMSLGEIPEVVTVELTPETAKRAVDVFAMVREKYADANLEDFESLQDFVEKGELGPQLDSDIKAAGFADVTQWNVAITTVGFAYTAIADDQTEDIRLQIEDIRNDNTIAQDLKDKWIASLSAMIPSDNNRKIVQDLMADPRYLEKLKLLDEGAE